MNRHPMNYVLASLFLWVSCFFGMLQAQEHSSQKVFTYEEFLGVVKKYHPLVKQANLILTVSEVKLLKARGYFDPKLIANFNQKNYHGEEYYTLFNGGFKIPTWYGIEFKATYDKNRGDYLNPQNYTSNTGLFNFGVSVPIGQGLWINQRMSELKKAKLYLKLGEYEQKLAVAEVLFNASKAYMEWKNQYEKAKLYENFYANAKERQAWIKKSIAYGSLSAIDSVESGINLKKRKLSWDQAMLKLTKSRLHLSNYLWTENGIPIELSEEMIPSKNLDDNILRILNVHLINDSIRINNHPKINALTTKINMKEIDRKLKVNNLLPHLSINYNLLTSPNEFNHLSWRNHKIGAKLSFPIFLRKERAALKLTKIQLNDARYGLMFKKQVLINKIKAKYVTIDSYQKQLGMNADLITDYQTMLDAEKKLFKHGGSSIFYINTRENKLLKAKTEQIELKKMYFISLADLQRILVNF